MASTHCVDYESSSGQWHGKGGVYSLSTSFSVQFWVKLETLQDQPFVHKFDASNGYYCFAQTTGADFHIRYRSAGDMSSFYVANFFTAGDVGEWVHCSWSVNVGAATATCYKNGVSQSVTTLTSAATTIGTNTALFRVAFDSGTSFYDGRMSNLRIWSKELSPTDVDDNWDIEIEDTPANLVGNFPFNSNATDTIASVALTSFGSPTFVEDVPTFGGGGASSKSICMSSYYYR